MKYNITYYRIAIDKAHLIQEEWEFILNGLTPELFQDAFQNKSTILSLKYDNDPRNKSATLSLKYDKEFRLLIPDDSCAYECDDDFDDNSIILNMIENLQDKGFVDISLGKDGNEIIFKVPTTDQSTNDYIKSINDAIKIHKSDVILNQINPKLIKNLEYGIKHNYFEKVSPSCYCINNLNTDDNDEIMYVMDQLHKMEFSNIHCAGLIVYFEIK